jgi:hypothetical protein
MATARTPLVLMVMIVRVIMLMIMRRVFSFSLAKKRRHLHKNRFLGNPVGRVHLSANSPSIVVILGFRLQGFDLLLFTVQL